MMSEKAKVLLNKKDFFSLPQLGDKTLLTQLKGETDQYTDLSNKSNKIQCNAHFPMSIINNHKKECSLSLTISVVIRLLF